MQDIISTFAFPHALVCDPFAGSGNTLLAAANLNMRCCGCDMHQPHHDRYVMRVFESRPGEYA
jgi:DNA modification methylase